MNNSINSLIQIPKNRYRGQIIDLVSGLYFFGNGVRAYSTKLRQFYSRDPKTPFSGGNLNRYQYAELDPINLWDITGFDSSKLMEKENTGFDSSKLVEKDKSNLKPAIQYIEKESTMSIAIKAALVTIALISAFGWFGLAVYGVVKTGGIALGLVLGSIGFLLCLIGTILVSIASYMEESSLKQALEIIAIILLLVGTIMSLAGSWIGQTAVRTGTVAARLNARFTARTKIGRFIDRKTLAYTGTGVLSSGAGNIPMSEIPSMRTLAHIGTGARSSRAGITRSVSMGELGINTSPMRKLEALIL